MNVKTTCDNKTCEDFVNKCDQSNRSRERERKPLCETSSNNLTASCSCCQVTKTTLEYEMGDFRACTDLRNKWKRVSSLTQCLQEERVSVLNLLLVQQAEESAWHVNHILYVEKQAVQVGWRRLQWAGRQKSAQIYFLYVCNFGLE